MIDEKKDSEFMILVISMVVLAIATVISMVLIFAFVPDTTRSIALAGSVSGVTVPIIGFIGLYLKTAQNQKQILETKKKVEHVEVKVDGRLEELLRTTAELKEGLGKAAGLIEGREAGMKEEKALETARQEKNQH